MKIVRVDPEIICLKVYFKERNNGVYIFYLHKLRSYWTKVHHIFTRCSQSITNELFKIRIAIFQSISECLRLRIKVNSRILPILTLKLVAIATFLQSSEKRSDP